MLLSSIAASYNILFWSLVVMVLIQTVAGMFMTQLVEGFINNDESPMDARRQVFRYYGTFWRSTITMFEITFANWAPACRLLVDEVHELFGLFFLIYRCTIGFAVLSVIQAVFIQQTMRAAQFD